MNKKVSTVAALATIALLTVGCANNSNNADKSSKSEKTSKVKKSSKKKSEVIESKEDDTKDTDEEKLTPEEMANKISLMGTHKYSMHHYEAWDNINDYLNFTVVDGKVTELVEINNYDEGLEPDFKKEADLKKLNQIVERDKGSNKFETTLKDNGNEVYTITVKYKVDQNKMEDLLDDSILKNGKFDVRYMVQKFAEQRYVLK